MSGYVTPGVYYETADREERRLAALRTDVAGFVGIATMGPLDRPVRLTSWRQFESTFGGIDPDAFLGYAIKAFFENGGRACWAVRVAVPPSAAAPLDPAHPASGPPEPGRSSTIVPAAGFVPGAVVTVTQEAEPVGPFTHVVVEVDSIGNRLSWDSPLEADLWLDRPLIVERVDGAVRTLTRDERRQPGDRASSFVRGTAGFPPGTTVRISQTDRRRVRNHRIAAVELGGARLVWETSLAPELVPGPLAFAAGAAAAETLLANEAGDAVLRVAAASPGSWANGIRIVATISSAGATQTARDLQPGDRRGSIVTDVSAFRRGDLVRLSQSGARPQSAYLVVAGVDARSRTLHWGYEDPGGRFAPRPLPTAFSLSRPISIERLDLSLSVYRGARLVQLLPALSLVPEHPRYAPGVIAAEVATLVTVEDLLAASPVEAGQLVLPRWNRWLEGGRDGLAALTPDYVIGRAPDAGIGSLAAVDEVAILAVPDAFIRPGPEPDLRPEPPPEPDPCLPGEQPESPPERLPSPIERPPTFGLEEAFRVQSAVVEQCETLRDRFAVLDGPPPTGPSPAAAVAEAREWRKHFDTGFAALYTPWLRVRDPRGAAGLRQLPPGGHVVGTYARFDLAEGVHRPPANGELLWVHDVAVRIDDRLQGVLNPEGINAVRAFRGRGVRVYGARTLSSDPLWRWVNVRRLLSMIEEAVDEGSQWAVFEPHTLGLRSLLRLGIVGFLEAIWEGGGLAGETAEQAFFVVCDTSNNPPELVDAGRLVADVSVAPVVPGEFIVFRVGRIDGQIEIDELGRGGVLANVEAA